MKKVNLNDFLEGSYESWSSKIISQSYEQIKDSISKRTESTMQNLEKVLDALAKEHIGVQHFSSSTGYGHGDQNREAIDRVFARVLGAERAAVRLQFVSGTHAICSALFGILRPGDKLLSITGSPYDTLEEVIGKRGRDQGSLIDFGISYEEIRLDSDGNINMNLLNNALNIQRRIIFIQRSCGYSWRPSLSIRAIEDLCKQIHAKQPNCICFVDNCYGELVEEQEPTQVGADLIAGSLIKNLGGTITPTGGYVAGKASLVEKACCRLTAPGIGTQGGSGFDLYRTVLQGLFLSPQMVGEALISAELVSHVFQSLGFDVQPSPGSHRTDIIQGICLRSPEALKILCREFQASSPIGSYLEPVPGKMPGYECELLMAGGTFIDGSTSEFSADAPLKPPYNLFIQGCTHHTHVRIALERALTSLSKSGFLEQP